MKLDKRIKKLSDILACVNAEEAKQFIGQKGYFTDDLGTFADLNERKYDTLTEVVYGRDDPFHGQTEYIYWRYFIPECRLKLKEYKYIPFETIHDLKDAKLYLSCTINFVNTKFLDVIHHAVINEVTYDDNTKELIDITLGNTTYSFESLFNDYQLLDKGTWVPFGKRVEE